MSAELKTPPGDLSEVLIDQNGHRHIADAAAPVLSEAAVTTTAVESDLLSGEEARIRQERRERIETAIAKRQTDRAAALASVQEKGRSHIGRENLPAPQVPRPYDSPGTGSVLMFSDYPKPD